MAAAKTGCVIPPATTSPSGWTAVVLSGQGFEDAVEALAGDAAISDAPTISPADKSVSARVRGDR
ncbi:hypothetical protein Kisp02_56670 [Kineosporia sp. NBRC 101731]|nr:hypothetical protein Kisp02_56670 [Kineosporia sp. NBRC 101731]